MKIWKLTEPFDYRFARAGRTGGTWQEGEYKERRRPLSIEWEPGSDLVGDFTWAGLTTDIVVSNSAGHLFENARVPGFELRPLEMRKSTERPKPASGNPMVRLPYQGPPLWDLWVTAWVRMDRKRSTVTADQGPDGTVSYNVSGVQREETTWDQHRMTLVKRMQPRVDGEGIFIPAIRGLFRVEELPAWVLCTDDVKRLVEDHRLTNICFLEAGDTLE